MAPNPLSDAVSTDVDTVVTLLASDRVRRIVRALDRPMTAAEVADDCDIPQSTAYRKLGAMAEAGLVRKRERDTAARYVVDFETVVVRSLDGRLEVELVSASRSGSEQLAELWDEVRAEADEM
jgi:DNA-binding IclR family transcriptional regulator